MTLNDIIKEHLCSSFDELQAKLPDYVGLRVELEDSPYHYIISLNQTALALGYHIEGDDGVLETVYTLNGVRVNADSDTINGKKIKSITPVSKRDLSPEEVHRIFDYTANVFDDTEKFQKFYGLMTETEDKTMPPYFIQKENLMMKIGHLEEELAEIKKAAENGDLVEFADGIIDLIYVASGLGNLCRLPMHQLWNDVQNSNMVGKERVKSLDAATKRGSTFDVRKTDMWVGPRGADIIEVTAETRKNNVYFGA